MKNKISSVISSGQSLFEVVVAAGLSAIILAGVVTMAAGTVRNSGFTRNNALATKYAQEEIEWLRNQRDADWYGHFGTSFTDKINAASCVGTFSWGTPCEIDTIFTRTATFTCYYLEPTSPTPPPVLKNCSDGADNINIVEVDVAVTWNDAQGAHEARSKTTFTNWDK